MSSRYIFRGERYSHFAISKSLDLTGGKVRAQLSCNLLSKLSVAVSCKDRKSIFVLNLGVVARALVGIEPLRFALISFYEVR